MPGWEIRADPGQERRWKVRNGTGRHRMGDGAFNEVVGVVIPELIAKSGYEDQWSEVRIYRE